MANNKKKDPNKWACVIAYIGILFFVPLLVDRNNQFNRFHANQALVLLITAVIVNLLGTYSPIVIAALVRLIGGLTIIVLMVMGVLNAANEKMKPLPLIGKFTIIK